MNMRITARGTATTKVQPLIDTNKRELNRLLFLRIRVHWCAFVVNSRLRPARRGRVVLHNNLVNNRLVKLRVIL